MADFIGTSVSRCPEAKWRIQLDDGIYFGLDEEIYHAQHRLSNSGMKWLRASPMDFWIRSWLNESPIPVPPDDTFAKTLGRAYHKRIIEGREEFDRHFVLRPDPNDHPDALVSHNDLKARCKELDLKVGGTKVDLIARLLEHYGCLGLAGDDIEIWDRIETEHAKEHLGKTYLNEDVIKRIEVAGQMLDRHPVLCKAFGGGQPEVSVLWTDRDTGVRMKCRYDYLKPRAIVDLKSYSNPHSKPSSIAVATAVANGRYQAQVATYLEAATYLPELLRKVRPPQDVDTKEFTKWCKMMVEPEKEFLFVFQQTGIAPVTVARIFPRNLTYDVAHINMRSTINLFKEYHDHFGTNPWVDNNPIEAFADEDFPAYINE